MNIFRRMLKRDSGFTLMELMIVMVIMAILVAIAMGSYASSSKRGRDNRRKSDLRSLATALEAYYNDKGNYPSSNAGVMVGCGVLDSQACAWGGEFKDANGTLYMVLIPSDPTDAYEYYYTSNGQKYMIYAKLENTRDAGDGVKQTGYNDPFSAAPTDCSSGTPVVCTYGIASQNATPEDATP